MVKIFVLIFSILASNLVNAMSQYQEEALVMNLATVVYRQSYQSESNKDIVDFINDCKTDSPFIHDAMKSNNLQVHSIKFTPYEKQLLLTMTGKRNMKFQ